MLFQMRCDFQKQGQGPDSSLTFATKTVFELGEIFLGALFSVHNGVGEVLPDYAFRIRLNGRWRKVWFINVFGWKMLELGNPKLYELSEFRFHIEAGFGIGAGVI